MASVTTRELRNNGGVVLDRVLAGERLTVTRLGRPVAELCPVRRRGPDPATLLERWRHLPHLDPRVLRHDLDQTIDSGL